MKISIFDNPEEAKLCVVKLNGKRVQTAVAADDTEGWVDIIDIASITSPNTADEEEIPDFSDPSPLSSDQAKYKRVYGQVQLEFVPVTEG